MMLMLLSEPDVPGPELFPHSDGKQFHGTFFGPGVPILEAWSRLDLSALRYCALDRGRGRGGFRGRANRAVATGE
jgi:hypothetical protein